MPASIRVTMRLRNARPLLVRAFRAEAREAFRNIKRRTPVKTGRLKRGWRFREIRGGFSITNRVPYAGYVIGPLGLIGFYLDRAQLLRRARRRMAGYRRPGRRRRRST